MNLESQQQFEVLEEGNEQDEEGFEETLEEEETDEIEDAEIFEGRSFEEKRDLKVNYFFHLFFFVSS